MKAKHSPRPPTNTPAVLHRSIRLPLAVCLLIAACGAVFWSWRQTMPQTPSAYEDGLAAQQAGNLTLAEQDWLRAERESPRTADADAALGDLYMQEDRFLDALGQYEAAAKIAPDDGTTYLRISRAQMALDNGPLAYQAAQRAASLRPDDPDAQGLCGLQAAREGDKATALTMLSRAVALRPNDGDYLVPLVRLRVERLDFADAEQELTPYIQSHLTDPEACFLMATLVEQKVHTPANLSMALHWAQTALMGLPGDRRVISLLGQIYLDEGHPAQALAAYQSGLPSAPYSEDMLHGMMTAYTELHKPAQAERTAAALAAATVLHQKIMRLSDQLNLDPANVRLGLTLIQLEQKEQDQPAIIHYLTILTRHNPTDPRLPPLLARYKHDNANLPSAQ